MAVLVMLCVSVLGAPKGVEFSSVKEVLLSLEAVKAAHCLHLWALTLGRSLVSVHLAVGQ
jgi:zinc transporter 2